MNAILHAVHGPVIEYVAEQPGPPVSAYMARDVVAMRDDCTLSTVVTTMLATGQRHVLVVDGFGAFLDVLPAEVVTTAWMTWVAARRPTVRDLLGTPAAHVSPNASMHEAASVMLTYQVDALGVLEPDGRLVGILTWSDILRMVAGQRRLKRAHPPEGTTHLGVGRSSGVP